MNSSKAPRIVPLAVLSVVKMSEMLDVENRVHDVLGELSTLWREVG